MSSQLSGFCVMGILNVTPDSFSDGGRYLHHDQAIAHGRKLIAEGAHVIDVGGESTRPGAEPVSIDEELARVVPVVAALKDDIRVSIDTTKGEVARAAVGAGATIVNDVSASLGRLAAELGAGWVAMHMQGKPRTMQIDPHYQDVVDEILRFLVDRAAEATSIGASEVWIDPGIGFGKTTQDNLVLLNRIADFVATGYPVALGVSRKGFLGSLLSETDTAAPVRDRVEASVAVAAYAITQGVNMVRVHDVEGTVRAARVARAIREAA